MAGHLMQCREEAITRHDAALDRWWPDKTQPQYREEVLAVTKELEQIVRGPTGPPPRSRLIDLLQVGSDRLVIFPWHKFQRVAHHMHDAELDLRVRVSGCYGIEKFLQTIDIGNQAIWPTWC